MRYVVGTLVILLEVNVTLVVHLIKVAGILYDIYLEQPASTHGNSGWLKLVGKYFNTL